MTPENSFVTNGFSSQEMRSLNLEFQSQQIQAFEQKVILQYNVYVILCFLHSLLKHYYVGVYSSFENLFKIFFCFKLCELLVIVSSSSKNFLLVLDTRHQKDDSEEYCGFYHNSNVVEHKNEGERQKCHGYICIYGISFSFPHKVEQE